MPDLTIEYIPTCKQNTFFTTKIQGSKNHTYTVTYCESQGLYSHNWFCTCPHNTFRHQECKHIKQAKTIKCNWGIEAFNGTWTTPNHDNTCPKCGGPTEVIKVNV